MFIAQHLSASELEAIAICFDTIRQVHRRLASNDEVLANKFNNGLKQMMEHLQKEMEEETSETRKIRTAVLAKRGLVQILVEHTSTYLQ